MWVWGNNFYGQLARNNTYNASSPIQVGSGTNWAYSSALTPLWLAIKSDGTMWACGNNNVGQLGINNRDSKSSPVQIGALTNWAKCFAGSYRAQCFAIKTDGSLWSWGGGRYGATAQNDTVDRSSPVQVGAATWTKASLAYSTTFLLKSDNTIWMTGRNHQGQLGQNNNVNKSSPTQVGALATWQDIALASNLAVLATKT